MSEKTGGGTPEEAAYWEARRQREEADYARKENRRDVWPSRIVIIVIAVAFVAYLVIKSVNTENEHQRFIDDLEDAYSSSLIVTVPGLPF